MVQLFPVSLQMDGTMVRAGLSWDPTLGFVVGCKEPLTFQDLSDMAFHLSGESSFGKTGREIVEKYTEMIKTASKCEACVKANAAKLNTIQPQIQCNSYCPECWSRQEVCETCFKKGRKTIYPQIERCFECIEKGLKCKKVVVEVLALDCFTGNRFLIEDFQKGFVSGTKDPEVFLTEPVGEIIHVLKTIKSSS